MQASWTFLAKIGAIPPEAYDAIFPQGPLQHGHVVRQRGVEVSLNPQPLPPVEVEVGAVQLRNLLLSSIIIVGGRGGASAFMEDIDDWCGTGWPHRWPHPKASAGWDDSMVFAGAALAAAGLAAQYDHAPEMQEALGKAAEQLAAQSVGG